MNVLLDTNVLIAGFDPARLAALPDARLFTSALCYAELAEGEFHPEVPVAVRAAAQLEEARALCGPGIPFGDRESRAYRVLCNVVTRSERALTRTRRVDLMIAATAFGNDMMLATRNGKDYAALDGVLTVVEL